MWYTFVFLCTHGILFKQSTLHIKMTLWIRRRIHLENEQSNDIVLSSSIKTSFALYCHTGWKNSRAYIELKLILQIVNKPPQGKTNGKYWETAYQLSDNLLWNKLTYFEINETDSIAGIALKNVWLWENEINVLSLSVFSYDARIVVYVTINIKCDMLNYDCIIGIYCNTFEQQSDISRKRLKRTIWTASGEPIFGGQNKHGETW